MLQNHQSPEDYTEADWSLLDQEHARLEHFLNDLRALCSKLHTAEDCGCCDREQVGCCQGRLNSFLYDFLDLVTEHFENEENILARHLTGDDGDTYLHEHRLEHARLMREVRAIAGLAADSSRQGRTSDAVRQLIMELESLFGDHAHGFDGVLRDRTPHRG